MSENEPLFQLVVVGSSAGGIEALSKLVSTLTIPFPVPLVIAQHLDPKRPSHLGEILARQSTLPVVTVEHVEQLQPGTVYVVPSNHNVEITDHDVTILPHDSRRPKPSIDLLLSTAAEVYGEKLIAVILTGTGSDGTLGAKMVHENGGTVIIQNPATAAYPGMPQSLASDTVDFVVDLPKIGTLLFDLINGTPVPALADPSIEIQPLLNQIHKYSNIDFSTYKPATILRRLQRRLVATNVSDLPGYLVYLQAHPEEYELLISSFLIKVTEFMRDPELFVFLREQIFPKLIEYSRKKNYELRFWSAGCATGEEAYSLAILLSELLGEELHDFTIKIFATDLDANAIAFARRGLYPAKALEQLPPELIHRYFNALKEGYEIKKTVRNLIVFGEHDLGQRAPFPHIDLVLCRNVLIYFSRELQQHALQLFAFALRDNGYLVLGRTETTSPLAESFVVQEPHQRIYQRQGQRRLKQPLTLPKTKPLNVPIAGQQRHQKITRDLFQSQQEVQQSRAARDNLLLKLPIGVVVVNGQFDIQEINSAARRLLSIYTVAIGEDFVHLAQYVSPRELGAAITKAIRENIVTVLDKIKVPHLTTGEATFLQITCYPQPSITTEANGSVGYALILITDITLMLQSQRELEQAHLQQTKRVAELSTHLATLEQANAELSQRNAALQQTNSVLVEANQQAEAATLHHVQQIEHLVVVNQSLLAANEEITTLNTTLQIDNEDRLLHTEEVQAAIEEADTLNEEMQASNEELETLNEELQATIEELNTSNAELAVQSDELRQRTTELKVQQQASDRERLQLAALLSSMTDAVMVVNHAGNIILTNAAYSQMFAAEKEIVLLDEGGTTALIMDDTPQARAAKGETFSMVFSFTTPDGSRQWWEAIGQPVRGNEVSDWGLVVMRDITERSLRHLQEQFSALVAHELRSPLTTIKGHNQMLQSWLEKQIGEMDKPLYNIRQALTQIERLQHLINDMTDFSRVQSGKFKIEHEELRLDSLLEQVVQDAQMLTTKQILHLESDHEPLLVTGDATRLQQVMLNLISNAITHAVSSPKIDVRLRRLENGQAEIRVQDYGQGIKAEHLNDIFSRFFQVTGNDKDYSAGLGLGLFISQQIITAHGGTIQVESTEGVGTTFIVQLPLVTTPLA